MSKPKIGLYWCASCGGCEESVVDLGERLLDLAAMADIVFWPVALDFKVPDVEALADGELAAVLINGAVRMSEQAEMARLLRRKARLVIAHGACAQLGGVVGLGDFSTADEVFAQAYRAAPSLAHDAPEHEGSGRVPAPRTELNGHTLELPRVLRRVRPLDRVIEVDYFIPGCPPTPDLLFEALTAILGGAPPPRGTVFGDRLALCDSCARRESKPEVVTVSAFKRVHQTTVNPDVCFLAQGLLCLGPATRGGCAERCVKANMPCTGCFGPVDRVLEQGAKAATMLASGVSANTAEEVEAFVASLPDPAGVLYRYSFAASGLDQVKDAPTGEEPA